MENWRYIETFELPLESEVAIRKSDIAKVLDLISLAMRIEVPESLSVFGEFCNEISTDLLDSGAMDLGNCS